MVDKPIVKKKRKVGRPAERNLKVFKLQEILNLSESVLIRVLSGKTNLPLKTVVGVALELYKRRVPAKVEAAAGSNQLTIIKVVKNHIPIKEENQVDITTDQIDNATEAVIRRAENA